MCLRLIDDYINDQTDTYQWIQQAGIIGYNGRCHFL